MSDLCVVSLVQVKDLSSGSISEQSCSTKHEKWKEDDQYASPKPFLGICKC